MDTAELVRYYGTEWMEDPAVGEWLGANGYDQDVWEWEGDFAGWLAECYYRPCSLCGADLPCSDDQS